MEMPCCIGIELCNVRHIKNVIKMFYSHSSNVETSFCILLKLHLNNSWCRNGWLADWVRLKQPGPQRKPGHSFRRPERSTLPSLLSSSFPSTSHAAKNYCSSTSCSLGVKLNIPILLIGFTRPFLGCFLLLYKMTTTRKHSTIQRTAKTSNLSFNVNITFKRLKMNWTFFVFKK